MFNNSKRNVHIAIFIFVCLNLVFVIYLAMSGNLQRKEARIKEVVICNEPILSWEISLIKDTCKEIFEQNVDSLYVCGVVEYPNLNSDNFIELLIYVFREKETRPIYINPVDDKFRKANFCREILIPPRDQAGKYLVEIYYYRKLLASTGFEIK
jgi:hypothetical protein